MSTVAATDLRRDLRAFLDGSRAWVRDRVREVVLADPAFAPVTTNLPDEEYRERVRWQLELLAQKEGGSTVGFPEEVGGQGDIGSYVTAFEMLGMADLSLLVKSGVQFGLFGGAIHHLGSSGHHQRYLPAVMRCELLGGFAMTESGHGSDVQQLRTTATYDPDAEEFVVHTPDRSAWTDYIGNAAVHGTHMVVFAQLHTRGVSHGVHAFIVPVRDPDTMQPLPGVTVDDDGHKAGLNGVDNGRLAFDHVRIPRENLLDRFASVAADGTYSSPISSDTKRFFTTIGTLVQGRISVAGGAIGATKRALTIATRHALGRRQFSPPDDDEELRLLDYRSHQRRLLPAVATTYALQCAQTRNVDELHRLQGSEEPQEDVEEERRRLEVSAAAVKATATWHASRVIQECREACGGAGYLAENLLPQLRADIDVFTTFEGDNTVLLQLVAKELLTGFRSEVRTMDLLDTARFFAEVVADLVTERTSARTLAQVILDRVPGTEPVGDLGSAEALVELMDFREEHTMASLVRRLRAGMSEEDADAFAVFNDCQDHMLSLARAHADNLVMAAFAAAVDEVPEASQAREVLDLLVELHGLSVLERDRAWFLEHDRLTAERAKAVTARVDELCAALRPHAADLVEAFGVPDQQLTAPIAQLA